MIKYVREHGIQQFINQYNRVKNIEGDRLLWGDEVEYGVLVLDEKAGTVKLSLRSAEILKSLQYQEVNSNPWGQSCNWVPEWGSWMIEGTPARPYSGYAADLVQVERNMRIRRARLLAALAPNEICPTIPCFPMMGVGDFTVRDNHRNSVTQTRPPFSPQNKVSNANKPISNANTNINTPSVYPPVSVARAQARCISLSNARRLLDYTQRLPFARMPSLPLERPLGEA